MAEIVSLSVDISLVALVEVGEDVGAGSTFGPNPLRVVENDVFADEFVRRQVLQQRVQTKSIGKAIVS